MKLHLLPQLEGITEAKVTSPCFNQQSFRFFRLPTKKVIQEALGKIKGRNKPVYRRCIFVDACFYDLEPLNVVESTFILSGKSPNLKTSVPSSVEEIGSWNQASRSPQRFFSSICYKACSIDAARETFQSLKQMPWWGGSCSLLLSKKRVSAQPDSPLPSLCSTTLSSYRI